MRAQRIQEIISIQFPDLEHLEIMDESDQHAGRAGQESHFKVLLVDSTFEGLSRVARQRKINGYLASEFSGGLHALSLRVLTPVEYAHQKSKFQSPNCQGSK